MSDQRGSYGSSSQPNRGASPNGSYASYQNSNSQGSGDYGSRNYGSSSSSGRYGDPNFNGNGRNNYDNQNQFANQANFNRGYNNQNGYRNNGYQGQPNYQAQGFGQMPPNGGNGGFGGNNNNDGQAVNIPWDKYELKKRSEHGTICTILLAIGSWITFARNLVFNFIFLLLMFFIFGGYMAIQSLKENGISFNSTTVDQINAIADKAEVLYFDLNGPISEMPFSSAKVDVLQREIQTALYGTHSHELVAIEKALELSANDKSIKKVIISIEGMTPMSLSMAERIGKAMETAKALKQRAEDKDFEREVVVIGTDFSQSAYAIAAHADKIVMDSLGEIDLRGISMTSLYFKDMLDKAEITPYIFRAGHFKSAVEPFMLNAMSPDVRREYQALAYKSWDLYKQSIFTRSAIKTREILPEANVYADWIRRYGGDRAKLQLAQGLVDEIKPLDLYFAELSEQVNADAERPYQPAIIIYQDYLMRHHARTQGDTRVGALSQVDVRQSATISAMRSLDAAAPALAASATKLATHAATSVAANAVASVAADSVAAATTVASATVDSVAAANTVASAAADSVAAAKDNVSGAAATVAADALANVADAAAGTLGNAVTGGVKQRAALQFDEVTAISEAKRQIERRLKENKKHHSNTVAVIYGIGEIIDTPERPTDFAYDNIAPQIEKAMMDDDIAAVVLYLNSPGGSVNASEKIRRQLEAMQKYTIKPVVVSMNGTAASGAYWIGSQAEKIFATKSTITGSIGVFGLSFGAHRLLNKYGAYQDGVSTNELAQTPIAKEMPYSQQMLYNLAVEKTYKDFVELVAKNRGIKANTYEVFAEGQVFLAEEARTLGLIDEVGDLYDAIAYAAHTGGVNPQRLRVKHMTASNQNELGGFESMLFGLSNAYLPPELTEAMLQIRQKSKLIKQDGSNNIMAISPLNEPKL